MKLISVVTACYNEEENVDELCQRVKAVFGQLPQYKYEHIFIDNASSDKTVEKLKAIAKTDNHIKIIVNARNFGHIRSPFYGLMQAKGDAVISIVCDLQDPPEMIIDLLEKWEEGYQVVAGVKKSNEESRLISWLRKTYYRLIYKISQVKQIKNYTGFGLYDRVVMDALNRFDDPYPYFRGMVAEVGFNTCLLPYHQPIRHKGITKNNFYTLYDMAILGITSYSKFPIRLAVFFGLSSALVSFLLGAVFLILKLIFWDHFNLGIAPMLVSMFFFMGVQLFFLGVLGEYIAAIHTQVQKRPLVTVKETVNFDRD